ncbi:uncharacterized protein RAG0_10783 [Rhynchosporium agropyri]|uniref:Uncharacterized protein n=3 Tax=Rhynchosporium TaxID=38037 RepID=A0A1E1M487_RHYSE|nr:uncharacterized protein RAG0_10783 [Rhynchosporium agropyri]CZT10051.1 uncharacterized protein RCO7_03198 [Rhynchosporium commune]CZT43919.1 uncharacterized protein RSE6_04026 [Rhynchosporium secalis]
MLFLQTLLATLIATTFAFPTPAEMKRELVNLAPNVSLDLLKDFCVGIAVCNPVTVNHKDIENC